MRRYNTGETDDDLRREYNPDGSMLRRAQLRMLDMAVYLQQAAKQLEEIRREAMRLREERMSPLPRATRKKNLEREVIAALTLNPSADAKDISNQLAIPVKTAYKLLQTMVQKRILVHSESGGFWPN